MPIVSSKASKCCGNNSSILQNCPSTLPHFLIPFPLTCNMRIFFLFLFAGPALSTTAQIQVSQEPRHHKVLDNEWVRVLDVHVPPHDTTMMHKHSTPSVFLV